MRSPLVALLVLFCCHTADPFRLEIFPKITVFQMGESSKLRCHVSDCSENVTFTWLPLEDKPLYVDIQSSSTESVLIYQNISLKHENFIQCRAKCNGQFKQAAKKIRVYTFPKPPVISGHEHLELGKENSLKCEVSDFYSTENMELEWLRDGKVVNSSYGEPWSLQSSYTFTPQRDDNGKQITCRATLTVSGLEPEKIIKETTVSMTLLSPPHNMRVSEPSPVMVGSNLSLKCEGDGNPKPDFSWRFLNASGSWLIVGEAPELSLQNVSLSASGAYECEARNSLGNTMSTVNVTVHGPPTNTRIIVSPKEPKETESLTISCMSDSSPLNSLHLSKVQEGKETELKINDGPQVSVSYHDARHLNSGLYVCKAVNAYGSQTAEIHIDVQTHPLEVSLQPDGSVIPVERGSPMTLSCKASGCPQPSITWHDVKQSAKHSGNHIPTVVSQLGPWTVELNDNRTFKCEVECGSVKTSKQTQLKVFSFPSDPTVESSGPFPEGDVGELTCTVRDVYPADRFQIQWLDGEKELRSERGTFSNELQILSSTHTYQVDIEDQNKTLTCKVSLEMDGVLRQRSASITLAVHYAPKNTTITVRPQEELMEGDPVTIDCLTDSLPEGRVILKKVLDGKETELRSSEGTRLSLSLHAAKLSDAGVYVCEAVNKHGRQRKEGQISVQAPPRNTTVMVYPSTHVHEGQNVTICCQAVSFPPPDIMLRKVDNGNDIYSTNGTFLLMNLTLKDTGLYQVNFTNALGYKTEFVSIQVMERLSSPPVISSQFIIPVGCLGFLSSVVGVLEYLRRLKRKGLYNLNESSLEML